LFVCSRIYSCSCRRPRYCLRPYLLTFHLLFAYLAAAVAAVPAVPGVPAVLVVAGILAVAGVPTVVSVLLLSKSLIILIAVVGIPNFFPSDVDIDGVFAFL
jgi:hypothetical protein